MADAPENKEAKRPDGANAIERLRMALAMSERDPNMRGISEGLSPVIDVLGGHETRLGEHDARFDDHEKRFGEHEGVQQMLAKIAQDYLQRRIDKRDMRELFGSWNKAYGGLDDNGRKDMDARGKFLRDKFLEARKLGDPNAKQFEGMDDDEAVTRAVLNQLRAMKQAGADPMEVYRRMADEMGYKPEEIQAEVVSDGVPAGAENLAKQGGAEAPDAENAEKAIDAAEKSEAPMDAGANPDAESVRARAKKAPDNRATGQNVMSADDLLKIKKKYGGNSPQFRQALEANAAAKHGF